GGGLLLSVIGAGGFCSQPPQRQQRTTSSRLESRIDNDQTCPKHNPSLVFYQICVLSLLFHFTKADNDSPTRRYCCLLRSLVSLELDLPDNLGQTSDRATITLFGGKN